MPRPLHPSMPSRLIGPVELADRLGVTEGHIRRMALQGRIPHVRVGKFIRFSIEEVMAWLDTQRVKPQR